MFKIKTFISVYLYFFLGCHDIFLLFENSDLWLPLQSLCMFFLSSTAYSIIVIV